MKKVYGRHFKTKVLCRIENFMKGENMEIYSSLNTKLNPNCTELGEGILDFYHPKQQIFFCENWKERDTRFFTFSPYIIEWAMINKVVVKHVENDNLFTEDDFIKFCQLCNEVQEEILR
jgi:hypothetical protein